MRSKGVQEGMVIALGRDGGLLAGGALRHHTAISLRARADPAPTCRGPDRRIRDSGQRRLFPVRAGSFHR